MEVETDAIDVTLIVALMLRVAVLVDENESGLVGFADDVVDALGVFVEVDEREERGDKETLVKGVAVSDVRGEGVSLREVLGDNDDRPDREDDDENEDVLDTDTDPDSDRETADERDERDEADAEGDSSGDEETDELALIDSDSLALADGECVSDKDVDMVRNEVGDTEPEATLDLLIKADVDSETDDVEDLEGSPDPLELTETDPFNDTTCDDVAFMVLLEEIEKDRAADAVLVFEEVLDAVEVPVSENAGDRVCDTEGLWDVDIDLEGLADNEIELL